jgi:hypothetical protein
MPSRFQFVGDGCLDLTGNDARSRTSASLQLQGLRDGVERRLAFILAGSRLGTTDTTRRGG